MVVLQKTSTITIKVNPILYQKFRQASALAGITTVMTNMIYNYVNEYEAKYWIIETVLSDSQLYDMFSFLYWIHLNDEKQYIDTKKKFYLTKALEVYWSMCPEELLDELLKKYPKTRKNSWRLNKDNWNYDRHQSLYQEWILWDD